MTCPSCGSPTPDGARFCPECGAALTAPPPVLEERKVVSVLFADLVGFTTRSDGADPEDVRAALRPYQSRIRAEVERFGGTLEKFAGDGVMAVFGAPVAREDDAERAVRAALRVHEAIERLNAERPGLDLAARAAVATGEAVVALDARADAGETLVAGDVVNTASRLEGRAPAGGVVVDERTRRAAGDRFTWEALEPLELRGKARPVPGFRVLAARSRFGVDLEAGGRAELVGRDRELALLTDVFERTVGGATAQIVTVVGEPGVGKSRLVSELRAHVDARPALVAWRQGRCISFGHDVAFWALGEIVKAEAGILESDPPERAAARLASAVDAAVDDAGERDWLRVRLAPLVGLGAAGGGVGRGESFAAWRRFLEAIAARRPLVIVVEDIHWADPAMVEFLDHLVSRTAGVPMLVVCTARPELFERHPRWGGGMRNATTIALDPLREEETARLVDALLARAPLPASTRAALIERSGGNPLFAEEFVRMALERGIGDQPMPETVQAIIAARLDTLAPSQKAALQDAAVVGKVFWTGAVAAIGGRDEAALEEDLLQLAAREFTRPARASSVVDQSEHAFWHALVRDVTYRQIPRAARAAKHVAAAEWIERIAGERVGDHAAFIASHYGEALALARASGAPDADDLAERAAGFLIMAAQRALALDAQEARGHYERALALRPVGHPQRGPALASLGWALHLEGDSAVAQGHLEAAIEELRGRGDPRAAADAILKLGHVVRARGDTARATALIREAEALLADQPPSVESAWLAVFSSWHWMFAGRWAECEAWAERCIALARPYDVPELLPRALQLRGLARASLGRLDEGYADLREALRLGLERGLGVETQTAYTNLADCLWWDEGPAAGLETKRIAMAFAESRGLTGHLQWAQAESTWMLFDLGRWDELEAAAEDVFRHERERGEGQWSVMVRTQLARVAAWRGEAGAAAELMEETLPRARVIADPQVLVPALATAAVALHERGEREEAARTASELLGENFDTALGPWLAEAVRVLVADAGADAAGALLDVVPCIALVERCARRSSEAALAEARGDLQRAAGGYAEAAEAWRAYGNVPEEAHARLAWGRCLLALGRRDEALAPLEAALAALTELGAAPRAAEAEGLLGSARALA